MSKGLIMTEIKIDQIYIKSDNIVAREIEGEIIIVPLIAGIGDMEDELFTLNETGKAIWLELDGKKSLNEIISNLTQDYDIFSAELEQDVIGFVKELFDRGILVEQSEQ